MLNTIQINLISAQCRRRSLVNVEQPLDGRLRVAVKLTYSSAQPAPTCRHFRPHRRQHSAAGSRRRGASSNINEQHQQQQLASPATEPAISEPLRLRLSGGEPETGSGLALARAGASLREISDQFALRRAAEQRQEAGLTLVARTLLHFLCKWLLRSTSTTSSALSIGRSRATQCTGQLR